MSLSSEILLYASPLTGCHFLSMQTPTTRLKLSLPSHSLPLTQCRVSIFVQVTSKTICFAFLRSFPTILPERSLSKMQISPSSNSQVPASDPNPLTKHKEAFVTWAQLLPQAPSAQAGHHDSRKPMSLTDAGLYVWNVGL